MKLVVKRDPNVDLVYAKAEAEECEALCVAIADCPTHDGRLHLLRKLLTDFTLLDVRLVD